MKRHLSVFLALLLAGVLATPALAWQTTKKKKKTTSKITSPVVPAGTELSVRIIEDLDSGKAQPGDDFHGTLTEPIVANGTTLYPQGADITGRVAAARDSGRLSRPGVLELELTLVKSGTKQSRLTTEPFKIEGKSHTKSNVTKIGGGAAAGAIIGAIAGGGKGAAIGAAVGAGAGTAVAAATGKQEAKVESEAVLVFVTSAPSTAATTSSTGTASSSAASTSSSAGVKSYDDDDPAALSFNARDRRVINTCFREHASDLPPGLAKRESLPPGLQRQLEKNGTLPPGLQKRVHPLPAVCENDLPRLPRDLERVIFSRRVMLIDSAYKILDLFDLDEE
ncbi:MAG: hypothetical protein L0099_00465 [Acidobacteria bacterium]|nr:hypothetical protein [Acidobacteriota bacterium]